MRGKTELSETEQRTWDLQKKNGAANRSRRGKR